MMKRIIFLGILLNYIFCQVKLETTISPDTILVGDRVFLNIEATLPEGKVANFPDIAPQGDDMQIVDKILTENTVTYVITFWEIGQAIIPELPVQILENGQLISTLTTESFTVDIVSVLDQNAADFRDIKGMQNVDLSDRKKLVLYSGIILLCLLIAIFLWRRRQITIKKAEKWKKPPDPPHIHAKKRLEKLKTPVLISPESTESFYLLLTEIFREYFAGDYFIKALEMTTSEFKEYLENEDIKTELWEKTVQLLDRSDLSKFARHIPDSREFESDIISVNQLIDSYHKLIHAGIKETA